MLTFIPLGIVLAAAAGLSDLAGSALVLSRRQFGGRWFDYLLPFGIGFALAIALVELIPAALEASANNAIWVLVGFSTLYLITRFLEGREHEPPTPKPQPPTPNRGLASGAGLTVLGVALCDFFDGVTVASAVGAAGAAAVAGAGEAGEAAGAAGWLLLAGLFPHNFLEGASIAALLLAVGVSRGATWVLVVVLAAASVLGGAAVHLAVPIAARGSIQAFAGGLLLHLVASERLPGLRGPQERRQAVLVVAGIAAFIATEAFLSASGLTPD